jgi:HupE / UreJ protein
MKRATTAIANISAASKWPVLLTAALIVLGLVPEIHAHGVSGKDALFLQSLQGLAIGPLMYLGAKHMVTGYDHLAFLVGVVFFLYRLKDIVAYVSLFSCSGFSVRSESTRT